jgi:lipoprotein-releasing system permease protein
LKISLFIARRLAAGAQSGSSKLIVRIAIAAVSISIAVMIVSVAVVKGYQHEIRNKITGFSAHIQLSRLDLNNSYQTTAIAIDTVMERFIAREKSVNRIQRFGIKAGIIKTEEEFHGIVLKGVEPGKYDWSFINQHLVKGAHPKSSPTQSSNQVLISERVANKLKLKCGDAFIIYFVQDPPRARKFTISGIFNTGFDELDETYAFVDLAVVQKLNNWVPQAITGYEIVLQRDADILESAAAIYNYLPYSVEMLTIRDLHPQLFEWLSLLDLNVVVIIGLMVIVACINMITALLILIVERTMMIGILKSLGSTNRLISSVFLYLSAYMLSLGLLIGNAAGVLLCYTQNTFKWFTLSQDAYYLSYVPIEMHVTDIVWINAGAVTVCILVLLIPSRFVSRIKPGIVVKAD